MAIMPRIRKLLARSPSASASTVGIRRESPNTNGKNVVQEDALRAELNDNPNNIDAFHALVEVVARNCAPTSDESEDPLTAEYDSATYSEMIKTSTWALAEELSGNPRAWYPLIELARLSIDTEPEETLRRFNLAVERDPEGRALAAAVALFTQHGKAAEAYNQAIGHWKPRFHVPEAGVAIARAALLSEKKHEAEVVLTELLNYSSEDTIQQVDPTLIDEVHAGPRV